MGSYFDLANNAHIADTNFTIQNVNLVSGILDNKALYAYKTLELIFHSPMY